MKKIKSKLPKLSLVVFGVLIGSISSLASSCSLTSNLIASSNGSGESSDSNKISSNSNLNSQNIELNIETINNLKNWNLYPSNIENYQTNFQNLIYSKIANFIDLNTGLIYDLTSPENINSLTSQYKKANPNASQDDIDKQIQIYQTTTNLLYLQVAPQTVTYWYSVLNVIDANSYEKWNLKDWDSNIVEQLHKFTNLTLDKSLNSDERLDNQNYQNYNYYNLLTKINELVNSKIFDDPNYTKFLNDNDKANITAIKKYVPDLIDEIQQFQQAYNALVKTD